MSDTTEIPYPPTTEPYAAFSIEEEEASGMEPADLPEWVEFQGRDEGNLLPYQSILSIRHTALETGDWRITFTSPGTVILVEGRHLGELVHGLKSRTVGFIREFDPQRWPQPDHKEAIVTGLTVTTNQKEF